MEFFAKLQALATGRMGAAMKLFDKLFTAHKFEKTDQGCVRGNGLPFAHHTLRVDNFACEHGAAVHGKLQNVHHFFAAIHFHVCSSGHKVSASLRLLWRSVIEQAPKRSDGAVSFDGAIVDINNARIGGGDSLPFCVRSHWRCERQQHGCNSNTPLKNAKAIALSGDVFQIMCNVIHARYYKVESTS